MIDGTDMSMDPYYMDALTREVEASQGDPQNILASTGGELESPRDVLFGELISEYGQVVEFVSRCFYLRNWRKVHGRYPYKLPYITLLSILAIEEEVGLLRAHEAYELKQKVDKVERGRPQGGEPSWRG